MNMEVSVCACARVCVFCVQEPTCMCMFVHTGMYVCTNKEKTEKKEMM